MSFYELSKDQRKRLVEKIYAEILADFRAHTDHLILVHFSDPDTYIRKSAYIAVGRIYEANPELRKPIIEHLENLFRSGNEKVRQTAVNAAGEIGMKHFSPVEHLMERALFDKHHRVRNAVIGSVKKMGQKNPAPVLKFAERFLDHENPEIRREICHGIELRGRTYPQDILPLLRRLEYDKTARVRNTLVHVLGQIAYKKGCLQTVLADLRNWKNRELVEKALKEIIDVHERYENFAAMTQEDAKELVRKSSNNN